MPATSIRDFIAPQASFSEEEIWEALKIACIDDDIEKMPMNINTLLSEGATNISGGQRQRIIIAKAVIKKPKILLLDEASSAVAEDMQETLIKNISKLNITVLAIAHRTSTLKLCDQINIFKKGKIVEKGTYDELIKNSEYFKSVASE